MGFRGCGMWTQLLLGTWYLPGPEIEPMSSALAGRFLFTVPPGKSVGFFWVVLGFGEGNSNPLQYSCLENPMDGEAWWTAVHGVAKSRTRLSNFTFTFRFHALEKEMATHSSGLAWRIPGTGELGGLPSMGLHRVGHDWSDLAVAERLSHSISPLISSPICRLPSFHKTSWCFSVPRLAIYQETGGWVLGYKHPSTVLNPTSM